MAKPWIVRHRGGWCALPPGAEPDPEAWSDPTLCGHVVNLRSGTGNGKPDCPDCLALLADPEAQGSAEGNEVMTDPGASVIRPEDVPEELVQVAHAHYSMHGHGLIRNILGGVLTEAGRTDRARWADLRKQVQQARDDYYEQACDHGGMTGHESQQERAFGRVEALDEVLGWLGAETATEENR